MSSNLDSGLISRELAERLGQVELKNDPANGEYELVDIRQQQIIGELLFLKTIELEFTSKAFIENKIILLVSKLAIDKLKHNIWGGGQNVEFHYYDWRFFSERRKWLLSWSLLRHHNVEILTSIVKVKNYLWRFSPMRLG